MIQEWRGRHELGRRLYNTLRADKCRVFEMNHPTFVHDRQSASRMPDREASVDELRVVTIRALFPLSYCSCGSRRPRLSSLPAAPHTMRLREPEVSTSRRAVCMFVGREQKSQRSATHRVVMVCPRPECGNVAMAGCKSMSYTAASACEPGMFLAALHSMEHAVSLIDASTSVNNARSKGRKWPPQTIGLVKDDHCR